MISHPVYGITEPGDCPYRIPVIVKRRIGQVLLEPGIDKGIKNDFLLAESPRAAKMIHGNEDPDGYTRSPHIACMKSLKNCHSLMLPRQQASDGCRRGWARWRGDNLEPLQRVACLAGLTRPASLAGVQDLLAAGQLAGPHGVGPVADGTPPPTRPPTATASGGGPFPDYGLGAGQLGVDRH